MFPKIVYAMLAWFTLWALGASHPESINDRAFLFAALCMGLGALSFALLSRMPRLAPTASLVVALKSTTPNNLKSGLIFGAVGALLALLFVLTFTQLLPSMPWIQTLTAISTGMDVKTIFIWSLIATPIWIALSRGVLDADFGHKNVLVLDALLIGFASQSFLAFLAAYTLGTLSHYLHRQYGIAAAAVGGAVGTLAFMLGLHLLGAA